MPQFSFKELIVKPPILFPLAALFHIIFTLYTIVSLSEFSIGDKIWCWPLSMSIFTLLSIGLCSLKRLFAIAYVTLSVVGIALIYFTEPNSPWHLFGEGFFPFSIILSFFILLFFKRFK